jgi:SAM-dependent methyltransferase
VARRAVIGVRWFSLALVAAAPLLVGLSPPKGGTGEFDLAYDPYVPTPHSIVEQMLALAEVGPDDLVVDLGSGDGRVVIAAAKQFGARALGVDIDRTLVAEAQEKAAKAGVAGRARFIARDFFDADLREATVLTLYLLPETNRKLLPKILAEMRPGARVVAHRFAVGEWPPDMQIVVDAAEDWSGTTAERWVYLWYVPASVAGEWAVEREGGGAPFRLALTQAYQRIDGAATGGAATQALDLAVLRGNEIRFVVSGDGPFAGDYAGRVEGDTMSGDLNGGARWRAVRRKPR